MDENKILTINKICKLAGQDKEFDSELRKRLEMVYSASSNITGDERIDHIYEYCIEKIIRQQAEDFYKDFPIENIKSQLVEDCIRMEFFHRKDNFGDFCLSLYQQIECMTNKLCTNPILTEITDKMWGYPAYIKKEKDQEPDISRRSEGDYSIAKLVFPNKDKNGKLYALEKTKKTLQNQYANDKIKIIVYFLGFKAMMGNGDYEYYKEITNTLNDIYQCRNMNHRGNIQYPWEEETCNRILSMKSVYYFKFLGALVQYIEYIKKGLLFLPEIEKYCKTINKKSISIEIKTVGKIDLKDDGKKRFK